MRRGLTVFSTSVGLDEPIRTTARLWVAGSRELLVKLAAHCCTPVSDSEPHTSYPQNEIPFTIV